MSFMKLMKLNPKDRKENRGAEHTGRVALPPYITRVEVIVVKEDLPLKLLESKGNSIR